MATDWGARERLWNQNRNPIPAEKHQKSEAPLSCGLSDFHNYVIDVLEKLLLQDVDPTHQAKAIATQFCRQQEPEDAWNDFLNSFVSAAMEPSGEEPSRRLALLLVALAKQPDARNLSGGVVTVDGILGRPRKIPSGEIIDFGGVRLFSGLPDFALQMREVWNGKWSNPGFFLAEFADSFPGPRAMSHSRWDSPQAARLAWTNINAFLAQLSRVQRDSPGELSARWIEDFGLWTITNGLEDANGIEDRARAAARWLLILGDIIYSESTWGGRERCTKGPGPGPLREGPLWRAELAGGASQSERWSFWKQRLGEIAQADIVDRGTRDVAVEAARHMAQIG